MATHDRLTEAVQYELANHRRSAALGDRAGAWRALEHAHIVSPYRLRSHLGVHWAMLGYAWQLRDGREVAGQLVRLALAPIGAAVGRIPRGNTGRSNVSAFAPMEIPADLRPFVEAVDQ